MPHSVLRSFLVPVALAVTMTFTGIPQGISAEPIAPSVPPRIGTPDDLDAASRQPDLRLTYKAVAGLSLPMALWLPQDRPSVAERRPAVLAIHGGAWAGWQGGDPITWDGGVFAPQARYFADRGAVAVTISYRHVPRPTKDAAAFEHGPTLFDLYTDCRSAVRYLRQHADQFGIDPQRIAVIGDSAGGHLAGCLATIDGFDAPGENVAISARADLAILCNPITDLTDPAWLPYVPESPQPWEQAAPLSRQERAKAISPAWHVSATSAPTLALHGLADTVVLPIHALDFQARMIANGRPCELFTLPRVGHAFVLLGYKSTGREWLTTMERIDQFLVAHQYLTTRNGVSAFSWPTPRDCIAEVPATAFTDGVVPGRDGVALRPPPAATTGVATTTHTITDPGRGAVLRINPGRGGLFLDGVAELGAATSASVWIKPEKLGGTLVCRRASLGSMPGFTLALTSQGALLLRVAGVTVTGGSLPLNQWSQITMTIASDRAALYIDGRLVAEQALADAVLIGSRLTVGEDYAGLISDFRIFDGPLSADAVTRLATPSIAP